MIQLIIIALIIYLVISKIIYPYLRAYLTLRFYHQQGGSIQFYAGFGQALSRLKDLKEHGDINKSFKELSITHKDNRFIGWNQISQVYTILYDPTLAGEMFKHQDKYWKPPNKKNPFESELGKGILQATGEVWKKHRKLTSKVFHFEMQKNRIPKIVEITDQIFNNLEQSKNIDLKNKQSVLNQVHMMNLFQNIAGNTVCNFFFGENLENYSILGMKPTTFIADYLGILAKIAGHPLRFIIGMSPFELEMVSIGKKYNKYKAAYTDFRNKIISQKEKEYQEIKRNNNGELKNSENMAYLFFKQREDNPNECYSDEEILSEFTTFLLAGTDTTGHLLIMVIYYLSKYPEIKKQVQEEIKKYSTSQSSFEFSYENLEKLDIMTAVFKETLRLSTPAVQNSFQEAECDHKLGDIKIKKGTRVSISYLAMNYNKEYHENPYEFIPERWLDKGSKTNKSISENPYVFTPFSGGGKNCIGKHMAMIEAKIILIRMLQRYDFEMSDKNYQLRMAQLFLYEPQEPILFDLKLK